MKKNTESQHYEESLLIPTNIENLFAYIDDHSRFSSHMNKSSWIMGGGRMEVSTDTTSLFIKS